jgi:hypothetical protein
MSPSYPAGIDEPKKNREDSVAKKERRIKRGGCGEASMSQLADERNEKNE